MARTPDRKFTLLDAMVLVAATALGFAWLRAAWHLEIFQTPRGRTANAFVIIPELLMPWTVAIFVLRLVPPRPRLRRVALQPGAVACGAVASVFVAECARHAILIVSFSGGRPWSRWDVYLTDCLDLCTNVVSGGPWHSIVTVGWGVLLVARRCRPEPRWIDRTGCAIGACWLLLALLSIGYQSFTLWNLDDRLVGQQP